eukprot:TRINITY_DN13021_c0_g1_i1.p1 TRINITY_DN13021_c0_g1~~TRINITY_DN13021_c0_g1_i1.p1  ORF type:complete len:136 (-),score=26.52 TRINITY_DN13021_c0_g1_i1:84-491(-)
MLWFIKLKPGQRKRLVLRESRVLHLTGAKVENMRETGRTKFIIEDKERSIVVLSLCGEYHLYHSGMDISLLTDREIYLKCEGSATLIVYGFYESKKDLEIAKGKDDEAKLEDLEDIGDEFLALKNKGREQRGQSN